MSDPVTAATPPLVDVIAEALAGHEGDRSQNHWWICCSCGADWPIDDHRSDDAKAEFRAHQARAVLDALLSDAAVERAAKAMAGIAGEWPHQYNTPDDLYRTSTAADRYRTRARAALMAAMAVEG